MTYRKVEVNGQVYEYVIGKTVVKVKGVNIWPKSKVGDRVRSYPEDKYIVGPGHIKEMIKFGYRKRLPKICKEHDLVKELVINPYAAEIYGEKHYMWMCEECHSNSAEDI